MVDFRVDRGGFLVPVAEQLPDLGERGPVAEELAGDRVAELVRAEPGPSALATVGLRACCL